MRQKDGKRRSSDRQAVRYNDLDEIALDSRGDYTLTQTQTQFKLLAVRGSEGSRL